MRYQVHDHVILKDKRSGIIQFRGRVKFARGEWFGIVLDDSFKGKNDGQVKGKRYFKCAKNKGIFIKKEKISKKLPCRKPTPGRRANVFKSPSIKSNQDTEMNFKLGGRVQCDMRVGTVKWIGMIGIVSYLGVELDGEFRGKNNGSAKGKTYFKCQAGQGIFWRTERVQHWLDSKISAKKTKMDPGLQVNLTSSRRSVFDDENMLSTKLEQSLEEQKDSNSVLLSAMDKLQSTEPLNEPRNTASTPLPKPIEVKNENLPETWEHIPSSPLRGTKSNPSSTPKSCRTQHKRGRKASPAPSFIHSSFPNESRHIRKSTEPLLVNIAGLVHRDSSSDSFSPVESRRKRAHSMSIKTEYIDFDKNIANLTRIYEKMKQQQKREENDGNENHIENQENKKVLVFEIQKLRKILERVKLEKTTAEEAKLAAEREKNTIEKQWNELKIKFTNSEDQIREERRLMEEGRELFCLEKAEFESNRRMLEEEVLARDEQLGMLKSQKQLAQQEILDMKVAMATIHDKEMKLDQMQDDLVSMQKKLESTLKEKAKLKQEVEQLKKNILRGSEMEMRQRRSIRKLRSKMSPQFVEEITQTKSWNVIKSEQECGFSSPHLSSDSQESFLATNITEESAEAFVSPHKGARRDRHDGIPPDVLWNNLSDSTCVSDDGRKRLTSVDLYSEISSINDQAEPRWNVVPSTRFESIASSSAEVGASALSPTNTGENQWNYEFVAPLVESRPSTRREDTDKDEDSHAEGALSTEAARLQLRPDSAEDNLDQEKLSNSGYIPIASLAESEFTNSLFNFSESLDLSTQSSAGEKESSGVAKHGKLYHTHSEQKVLKTPKLRKKFRGKRKRRMESRRSHMWSDSSCEDTFDFKSRIPSQTKISNCIEAQQKLLGDICSSEDSQKYVTKRNSAMVYNTKRRPLNCRGLVSESQVDYSSLVKERLIDIKDPYQLHFLDNAPSTTATLQSNKIDNYSQQMNNREGKLSSIRKWIDGIKEDISSIEINPKTFDEVKVILGQGRTKLIQQKLTELRSLIGNSEDLKNDSISDHSRHLPTMVEECERELLQVGKDWKKKIGILSWKVKNNLASLLDDYWKRAKGVREELLRIQGEYAIKNHPRYKTIKKLEIDVKKMQSDNARIKILKENVDQLKECGEFLSKMKTLETEDCLCDATELSVVWESVSKKIRDMTDTLKSEYIKQKQSAPHPVT